MKSLLTIIFSLLYLVITSQTYEGKTYNVKNGLCDNEVLDLFQDSKGYLWILTPRGLNLYDGKSMKKYPEKLNQISESAEGFIYGTGLNTIHKFSPLKKIETVSTGSLNDKIYVKERNAF